MKHNSEEQAFPSPKQILGHGEDYHEIAAKSGLSKLEYALIHSTWEPSNDDINAQARIDRNRNPYNESNKPALRTNSEIIRDLKISYFKTLLNI